jgi:hypothetical protein
MQSSAQGDPKMMRQVSMLLTDIANGHPTDKDAHFLVLRYKNIAKK